MSGNVLLHEEVRESTGRTGFAERMDVQPLPGSSTSESLDLQIVVQIGDFRRLGGMIGPFSELRMCVVLSAVVVLTFVSVNSRIDSSDIVDASMSRQGQGEKRGGGREQDRVG
jgi:hypothetical protein